MDREEILQIYNPHRILLKRSLSEIYMDIPNIAALNLRNTKSFTGTIGEAKSPHNKLMKKLKGNYGDIHFGGIATKDLYNNDTIIMNRETLFHQGKGYSIYDIAFCWKKDCRMWLWKNGFNLRRNKSVGDQFKLQPIMG